MGYNAEIDCFIVFACYCSFLQRTYSDKFIIVYIILFVLFLISLVVDALSGTIIL